MLMKKGGILKIVMKKGGGGILNVLKILELHIIE